jgi:hypothetical protein
MSWVDIARDDCLLELSVVSLLNCQYPGGGGYDLGDRQLKQ